MNGMYGMYEMKGKKSLMKRVNSGEIHISPSDKGKGVVVWKKYAISCFTSILSEFMVEN